MWFVLCIVDDGPTIYRFHTLLNVNVMIDLIYILMVRDFTECQWLLIDLPIEYR